MDQMGGYLSITVAEEEGQHIGVEGKYRWPHKKETWAPVQAEGTEPRRKLRSTEAWREGRAWVTMWEIGGAFSFTFKRLVSSVCPSKLPSCCQI